MNNSTKELTHLAIILDGNRRFAKQKNQKPWEGHDKGAEVLEKLLDWSRDLGIKELTLYTLSTENLNREEKELEHLYGLFRKWFKKFKDNKKIDEEKIKISFIGNLNLVPKDIKKTCLELQEKTKENNNYRINFCFAYGGRQELTQAINTLLKQNKKQVSEQDITNSLQLQSEPELVIRTGGKMRTSNFLPWQTVYSEWLFLDKMWPEFIKKDLEEAIERYNQIQRNFGK